MITTKISDFIVERILMDKDASHDVLFAIVLSKMGLKWNRWEFSINETTYFGEDQHVVIGCMTLPLARSQWISSENYSEDILFSCRLFHSIQWVSGMTFPGLHRDDINMEQPSIKFLINQRVDCVWGHPVLGNESYNAIEEHIFAIRGAAVDILDTRGIFILKEETP